MPTYKQHMFKLDTAPRVVKVFILKQRAQGVARKTIVDNVYKKFKYKTNWMSLGKWLDHNSSETRHLLLNQGDLRNVIQEEYLPIILDFRKLRTKTWELIAELEESGNVVERLKAFQEIREQIKLANEMLGMVRTTSEAVELKSDLRGIGVKVAETMDKINKDGSVELKERTIDKDGIIIDRSIHVKSDHGKEKVIEAEVD